MKTLKPYVFLLFAGLLYTLGFPNIFNIYIPFTPIIATAMLLSLLFQDIGIKKRIQYYCTYNLSITVVSFYWITDTLQEFGDLPFIVAAVMNMLYTFIFNPQYWILIILITLIKKYKPSLEKYYFKKGIFTLTIAVILTTIEYFLPQQFPVMLGQPWIIYGKHLGLASIVGLPAFSFISYLCAAEVMNRKKLSYTNVSIILVFIALNLILSTNHEPAYKDEKFNVRLVQANISNFMKVESEKNVFNSTSSVISKYKQLSTLPFNKNMDIDLIVWPETAYPYPIFTRGNFKTTRIPHIFQDIIYQTQSQILFGGYDHFRENPKHRYFKTEYNSAIHLNESGTIQDIYHKHILIPFGETLPLGPLNAPISDILPQVAFFAEGSTFPLFKGKKDITFISTICYEILRPEFIRDYLNSLKAKPDFMINLTNDSWYGNTVEPEQHLFLTRWRAIENRLPIIRSTNTGISTYIDHNGMELKRLNYDVTGNLDLEVPVLVDKTLSIFQKFGFLTLLPIWLLCFLFHIFLIKLNYDKNN